MERRQRAQGRVRHPKAKYKLGKVEWRDPYPEIMGTKPEKMVFAELMRRQVPFWFQYSYGDVPGTLAKEDFRFDFWIPSTKTVIEVNGNYWHTLEGMAFKDALRRVVLEQVNGWHVVQWWESDILTNLQALFATEPLLDSPPVKGPPLMMVNKTDDLKSMRRVAAKRRGSMRVTVAKSPRASAKLRKVGRR